MNINDYCAKKLYAKGFTFRHFQEHPCKGMVYEYNGTEWIIGGKKEEEITKQDKKIIEEGTWLPSVSQMMQWLQNNHFTFAFVSRGNGTLIEVRCTDSVTGTMYHSDASIEIALAATIRKILSKKERQFDVCDQYSITLLE